MARARSTKRGVRRQRGQSASGRLTWRHVGSGSPHRWHSGGVSGRIERQQRSQTGPRAGDQSLYWHSKSHTDTALFDTSALVRVGQVDMEIDVTKGSGYVDTKQMGQLATKMVSRLKGALKGSVKPSPLPDSDQKLLLPLGTDVTLAASVRLPVEAAPELLGASSPQDIVDSFMKLSIKDFLYGDYALNAAFYAKKTLLAGFTSVRNLGDNHNATIALRRAINLGMAEGPRVYSAGKSIAGGVSRGKPIMLKDSVLPKKFCGLPKKFFGLMASPFDIWASCDQR